MSGNSFLELSTTIAPASSIRQAEVSFGGGRAGGGPLTRCLPFPTCVGNVRHHLFLRNIQPTAHERRASIPYVEWLTGVDGSFEGIAFAGVIPECEVRGERDKRSALRVLRIVLWAGTALLFLNLNNNLFVLISFDLGWSGKSDGLVNQDTFPTCFRDKVFKNCGIMPFKIAYCLSHNV